MSASRGPRSAEIPIAAVRISHDQDAQDDQDQYPRETWSFTTSQKEILSRPDEAVIWETDPDALAAVLHQRSGGTEQYTYAHRTGRTSHHDGKILHPIVEILDAPVWTGPLDPKAIGAFLQKHHKNLHIPVGSPEEMEDIRKKGGDLQGYHRKNLKKIEEMLKKLQRRPIWNDYDIQTWGHIDSPCRLLRYSPNAGEMRRRAKAEQYRYNAQRRKSRAAAAAMRKRYNIELRNEDFGALARAYFAVLQQAMPESGGAKSLLVKQMMEFASCQFLRSNKTCTRMRKNKLVETLCFLLGWLRVMGDPHHKMNEKKTKAVRRALKVFAPYLGQLKRMVMPLSLIHI